MHRLKGFLYSLVTRSRFAWLVGSLFGKDVFDMSGRITTPVDASPQMRCGIIFGAYEYSERYLIRKWLPRDCDVVELGASIGVVSREILNRIAGRHRLVAVEASEELARLAELNIGFRHPTSRWHVLCCAVAYTADEVYFNAGQEHVAGRIVTTPQGDGGLTSKVKARTLSSIISQCSVGEYSLVMDVEGAEHELIAHDKEALSKCRCIIAELHGNSKDKAVFCEAMTSIGMRIVEQKHSVVAFLRL